MKIAQFLLAMIAAGSVLAFGGVEPHVIALMEVGVAGIAVFVLWRTGWPVLPRMPTTILAVLVLLPSIQMLPLPRELAAWVSPAWAATNQAILSPWGLAAGWITISVQPHATLQAGLRLVCYLLVFALAFQFHRQRLPSALLPLLLGIGLFEAAYGLLQYLTGSQYIFTYLRKYPSENATGTYINRNHFAGLLEMVLPFILASLVVSRPALAGAGHGWRRSLASSGLHSLRNTTLFATVFAALLFSSSKAGITAGLAGVLLVLVLGVMHAGRRALWLILLILALPAAYSLWIGLTPVAEHFQLLARPGALENERLPLWRDAVAMSRDYPWIGSGLGTYYWVSPRYQTGVFCCRVDHPHNDYLEFAAELGIPAALLLFGSLWVLVVQVAQRALVLQRTQDRVLAAGCAGALAALLIHSLADFNLQIPANAMIFAWIAGTATALVHERTVKA